MWCLICSAIIVGGVGCKKSSSNQTPVDDVSIGKSITDDATLGLPGNGYTCITCHRPVEAERVFANTVYPAYDMEDIASYPTYWSDTLHLRDAVNKCITQYMRGTSLTSVSDRWIALQAYLQSVSLSRYNTPRKLAFDSTGIDHLGGFHPANYDTFYQNGNASFGHYDYTRYCSGCHGNGLNGAADLTNRPDLSVGDIAIKTRFSTTQFNPGGMMPFFTTNVLSPDTLRDIIAYIRTP